MATFEIISSAVPAVTLPVNQGEAMLGILAAFVVTVGVLSLAHATLRFRKQTHTSIARKTALASA